MNRHRQEVQGTTRGDARATAVGGHLLLGVTIDHHTEIGTANAIDHRAMTIETVAEAGIGEEVGAGAEISEGIVRPTTEGPQAGRSS